MACKLEGTYFENCSCEVVCPCTAAAFGAPADYVGDAIEIEVGDVASPFDPDGEAPRLTGTRHPANDTLTVARAASSRVSGMGIEFSGDGKSAFSSPFSWSG